MAKKAARGHGPGLPRDGRSKILLAASLKALPEEDDQRCPAASRFNRPTPNPKMRDVSRHKSMDVLQAYPNFPNSAKKVRDINTGIAKVSTTRHWLGGERSFLAR